MRLRNHTAVLGLLFAVLMFPTGSQAQYVGVSKCRPCHLPQTKSWEQTKMAKAFDLLKPGIAADKKAAKKLDPNKDYTHDTECLPCHTTGYGKPGGFQSIEATPGLAGVQCEVCHGPGGGYLKPTLMSLQNKAYKRTDLVTAGLTVPDVKICQGCHNPKSPFYAAFNYESRKAQGTHEHLQLNNPH